MRYNTTAPRALVRRSTSSQRVVHAETLKSVRLLQIGQKSDLSLTSVPPWRRVVAEPE